MENPLTQWLRERAKWLGHDVEGEGEDVADDGHDRDEAPTDPYDEGTP